TRISSLQTQHRNN
ncbi:hypothetical protein VC87395_001292B, partial [Vibrio paracholerae 87395]